MVNHSAIKGVGPYDAHRLACLVACLVVERNISIVMSVGGGMSSLLHLWLGARATGEVRITTDRGKVRSSSGEVVIRDAIRTVVGIAVVVIRAMASRMRVTVSTTGLEGCTRETTVRARNRFIGGVSWLPVDRVHPLVKFVGAA